LLYVGLFINVSMAHYVYILRSQKDGHFYIGETSNVEQRLAFHNSGRQRSTKSRIVYTKTFPDRASSLSREKQIKSWKGGKAFHDLIKIIFDKLTGCSPLKAGRFVRDEEAAGSPA
jgi:putative endonuclease